MSTSLGHHKAGTRPGRRIALVGTDFDGTVFAGGDTTAAAVHYQAFRGQLRQLRQSCGTRWAMVTGRHVAAMPMVLNEMMMHGLIPDFMVMEDARIYRRRGVRFRPFWWWNFTIWVRRRRQLARHRQRVRVLMAAIEAEFPQAVSMGGKRLIDLWYEFDADGAAEAVERRLQEHFAGESDFFVFRWGREVCLAPTAGTKGEAVRRLAAELGAPIRDIFTIGDGQNDLSMLDPTAAGLPACVANAQPEVHAAVRRANGFIASAQAIAGVVEALKFYTQQKT